MEPKLTGRGGPGRGQGRKPAGDEAASRAVSSRLTPAHYEKYKALGGTDWLRTQIENAPDPRPRPQEYKAEDGSVIFASIQIKAGHIPPDPDDPDRPF